MLKHEYVSCKVEETTERDVAAVSRAVHRSRGWAGDAQLQRANYVHVGVSPGSPAPPSTTGPARNCGRGQFAQDGRDFVPSAWEIA